MELYTSYHDDGFDIKRREIIVKRVVKIIRKYKLQKYTIVVTGLSGVSIGFPVAHKLRMPIAVVRKRSERNHASTVIEGYQPTTEYIIIDDFIDTGATLRRIHKEVRKNKALDQEPADIQCKAILLYDKENCDGETAFRLAKRDIPIYYP